MIQIMAGDVITIDPSISTYPTWPLHRLIVIHVFENLFERYSVARLTKGHDHFCLIWM
jgi:hypothetical protein